MTPIERAARAICDDFGIDPDRVMTAEDDAHIGLGLKEEHPTWTRYTSMARAVLTAIREPSEAVRKAMRDTIPVDGHEWEYLSVETLSDGRVIDPEADHWRAMIDAALDDG